MTLTLSKDKNIIELARIMQVVEQTEKELKSIELVVNSIDVDRLTEIVRICKSGLSYKRIYTEKITYSRDGNNYRTDDITYAEQSLKGCYLDYRENKENKYNTGREEEEIQLWIMQDGSWQEWSYCCSISYYQGHSNSHTRKFIRNLTTDQVVAFWDTNDVINGIRNALEIRLSNLGDRSKSQKTRLEKLKQLQVV